MPTRSREVTDDPDTATTRNVVADLVAQTVVARADFDKALLQRFDTQEARCKANDERYEKIINRLMQRPPMPGEADRHDAVELSKVRWTQAVDALKAYAPVLTPLLVVTMPIITLLLQAILRYYYNVDITVGASP